MSGRDDARRVRGIHGERDLAVERNRRDDVRPPRNRPEPWRRTLILRRLLLATPILAAAMVAILHPWSTVSAKPSLLLPNGPGRWPPVAPDDIVNVKFVQVMTAGQSVTVFTVPKKRHLVVTAVGLVTDSGQDNAQLLEHSGQGSVVRLVSSRDWQSSLGIGFAFAPGSSVDVLNTSAKNDQVTLQLFGYLAPSTEWPPIDPSDMFDTLGSTSLTYEETFTIYRVPSDRWLVLTSNAIQGSGYYALLEDFGGTQTEKPLIFQQDAQLVGIVFHPGSSVVLRNDQPFGSTNYNWLLTGYLTK